jgi:hypothetical protein
MPRERQLALLGSVGARTDDLMSAFGRSWVTDERWLSMLVP